MTTKRIYTSRTKAIKKWILGRKKVCIRVPSKQEICCFVIGYNMGIKDGRYQAKNPKVQISPYKPVLDKLCRGEITFEEAAKTLNRTEEQIEKKLNDYEYVPTLEEEKEANKMMLESLKYLKSRFGG